MDWLHETLTAIADRTGLDASAVEPDADVRRALLDIARVASHTSGDRTNAPLLCYVLGQAAARGVRLDDALAAVKEHARET